MIRLFAIFFAFGATMCALTIVLLLFPGTSFDSLWRLNPEAQSGFRAIGKFAPLLMFVVGAGCALAAIGLWRQSVWGHSASANNFVPQHRGRPIQWLGAP